MRVIPLSETICKVENQQPAIAGFCRDFGWGLHPIQNFFNYLHLIAYADPTASIAASRAMAT